MLKMLEGKNFMKGNRFMEGAVLFVSVVFFVLALFLYMRRDETEGKKFSDIADGMRNSLGIIETTQKKIQDDNKSFTETTVAMLADLNKRLNVVEVKRTDTLLPHQPFAVRMTEPIEVNINYKEKEPSLMAKKPLLKRAGITSKGNN
jgi:hypothetical protein